MVSSLNVLQFPICGFGFFVVNTLTHPQMVSYILATSPPSNSQTSFLLQILQIQTQTEQFQYNGAKTFIGHTPSIKNIICK